METVPPAILSSSSVTLLRTASTDWAFPTPMLENVLTAAAIFQPLVSWEC